jgi:hypothetical protein
VGYIDADMAGDIDDRKSTSGVLHFLDESAVSCQSAKGLAKRSTSPPLQQHARACGSGGSMSSCLDTMMARSSSASTTN